MESGAPPLDPAVCPYALTPKSAAVIVPDTIGEDTIGKELEPPWKPGRFKSKGSGPSTARWRSTAELVNPLGDAG